MSIVATRRRPYSWLSALDAFETHLRAARKAMTTVADYRRTIGCFRDYLGGDAAPSPKAVTVQHLREYQVGLFSGKATRWGKPGAPTTVSRITTTLTSFFRFLADEALIPADPTARLERPKRAHRAPGDVLSVPEVRRVLGACDKTTPLGLRDRAMVELLYATGVRRAELVALDLSDLNRDEREVTVRHGKGDKARVVPLTRSAFEHVVSYLERARPVLATTDPDSAHAVFLSQRGHRLIPLSVKKRLEALRIGAKIKRRLTCHTMRRTFATHLLKGGVSLRHIQELLGHSNLNTTALYLRLNTDELRREILLRHPRERINA